MVSLISLFCQRWSTNGLQARLRMALLSASLTGLCSVAPAEQFYLPDNAVVPITIDQSAIPSDQPTKLTFQARRADREKGVGYFEYHGMAFLVPDRSRPGKYRTNLVDITFSPDRTRILFMVEHTGPAYFSTNSGTSWELIDTPGNHDLIIDGNERDGGIMVTLTIVAHPKRRLPPAPWYAVASDKTGNKVVVSGNTFEPAPLLTINRSTNSAIISWPKTSTEFYLEQTADLVFADWAPVTNSVQVVDGENRVTIPATNFSSFFRLKSAQ